MGNKLSQMKKTPSHQEAIYGNQETMRCENHCDSHILLLAENVFYLPSVPHDHGIQLLVASNGEHIIRLNPG